MKLLLIALSFFTCITILGQEIKRTSVDDAFSEVENNLTLRFYNALDGFPINKARVEIDSIGIFTTDSDGSINFPAPQSDGIFRVKFEHPKFITSEVKIEVMAGTLFFNRFSISPKLPLGALRIVLDWDKYPEDLDLHLVKKGEYHISFRDMKNSDDNRVKLDRDDKDGYGPETITIGNVETNGEYLVYVNNYSNRNNPGSSELSKSKATIKVFGGDEMLEYLQVPVNQNGTYWNAFKIENGKISVTNGITGEEIE
jgi:hypothetical protein